MAEIVQLPFDIIEPVVPPGPPQDFTWAIVAGVSIAVMLVALALVYWRRTRQRRLARALLAQAQRASLAGTLAQQDAAYAIAEALRAGFGVRQISAAAASDARWQAFVQRLDQLRYSASGAEQAALPELFTEAAFWLRNKPPC